MSLTVGSLFAGIGGFDLAAERVGFTVKWQVEIDDYCRKTVLPRHFPTARRYVDVQDVHGWLAHRFASGPVRGCWRCLEPVDIIVGGFPCQDISHAGRRVGIRGKRSGLWSHMVRVIGELRPRVVFVENVAALLVRGLDVVLGDLAAIGFDAEWDCIPASAVGAPHRRDRVWIVAYPNSRHLGEGRHGCGDPKGTRTDHQSSGSGQDAEHVADAAWIQQGRTQQWSERERTRASRESLDVRTLADAARYRIQGQRLSAEGWQDFSHVDGRGTLVAYARRSRLEGPRYVEGAAGDTSTRQLVFGGGTLRRQWEPEPDVGRVAHGIPNRVDRLRGLGNAIVPQVAEWIFQRIKEAEGLT